MRSLVAVVKQARVSCAPLARGNHARPLFYAACPLAFQAIAVARDPHEDACTRRTTRRHTNKNTSTLLAAVALQQEAARPRRARAAQARIRPTLPTCRGLRNASHRLRGRAQPPAAARRDRWGLCCSECRTTPSTTMSLQIAALTLGAGGLALHHVHQARRRGAGAGGNAQVCVRARGGMGA